MLTDRQARVLVFIEDSIVDKQRAPTLREIGEHFGIGSTNGVSDHLKAIERKGWIVVDRKLSRGIRVLVWSVERRP